MDDETGINLRLLGDVAAGGVAFDSWHRLDDLEVHLARELDRDWLAFVHREGDFEAFLEVLALVTDDVVRHRELFVGPGVHERVAGCIMEEVLHVAVLHVDDVDRFGHLKGLLKRAAALEVLDAGAHKRRALAWVNVLELSHDPWVAVLEHNDAFLDV